MNALIALLKQQIRKTEFYTLNNAFTDNSLPFVPVFQDTLSHLAMDCMTINRAGKICWSGKLNVPQHLGVTV
jgi:hypothetical protein